jgi:hypothetical protein
MSEKGKIVKTTHIANFDENGMGLTDEGSNFLNDLKSESTNKFAIPEFKPEKGFAANFRWGCQIEQKSESILCGCSRTVKLA